MQGIYPIIAFLFALVLDIAAKTIINPLRRFFDA